jgi:hypothetical protein
VADVFGFRVHPETLQEVLLEPIGELLAVQVTGSLLAVGAANVHVGFPLPAAERVDDSAELILAQELLNGGLVADFLPVSRGTLGGDTQVQR